MSLEAQLQDGLKQAMKDKDQAGLRALRAVKSAILLAKTEEGGKSELGDADIIKIVQKLVKQRDESIAVYVQQGREDLAKDERAELKVLREYLPKQLTDGELAEVVKEVIAQTGASSKADMGKVIGAVRGKVSGQADGKRISQEVAKQLG